MEHLVTMKIKKIKQILANPWMDPKHIMLSKSTRVSGTREYTPSDSIYMNSKNKLKLNG